MFSAKVCQTLGHYVYLLLDPLKDDEIFYVGKASGNNRPFDHLRETSNEEEKSLRIQQIKKSGLEPKVEILRHGMHSKDEALEVEAAVIDAIGFENLTNKVRGHDTRRGRKSFNVVNRLFDSDPFDVDAVGEPYMLFFLNKSYSPTMSELEIYEATRQAWYQIAGYRMQRDANGDFRYPVALAIFDSVVIRAYRIAAWFPAGTTFSTWLPTGDDTDSQRWEFVGRLIPDHELVGKRLQKKDGEDISANQRGFMYLDPVSGLNED